MYKFCIIYIGIVFVLYSFCTRKIGKANARDYINNAIDITYLVENNLKTQF